MRRPWPRARKRRQAATGRYPPRGREAWRILEGKLISGPWRCDSCNSELNEGVTAYLYAAYPRDITEAMDEYGFEIERFKLTSEDRMALYGAAWPCGPIAQMLGRSSVTAGLPLKRRAVGNRAAHAEADERWGGGAGRRRGMRRAGDIPDAGAALDLRARTAGAAQSVAGRFMFMRWAATPSVLTTTPIRSTCATSCQIERIPEEVTAMLKAKCPGYTLDTTREGETPYLINH